VNQQTIRMHRAAEEGEIMRDIVRHLGQNLESIHDEMFSPLQGFFDQFFQEFFDKKTLSSFESVSGYPKMDILTEEVKGEMFWKIRAAIPGVDPDVMKVEVFPETNSVRISGEMSAEYKSPTAERYYARELHKSRFSREIPVPENAKGDPEAEIKNGILTLTWKMEAPKKPERKMIPIKK
jgi:HSP20 family molecular chaperone IbpA